VRPNEDTRERFLAAIADRLNRENVIETHLFQPLRQGEFESGVAVVAVEDNATAGEAGAAPADAGTRVTAPEARAENRLVVYTAKYRLTIKGSERGKWEFDMHAEADAPLVTVETVVRGVQRRSGDAQDPERLTGDEFRALLPPPAAEPAQGQSA
jgi:hypothetical protein